MLVLLPNAGSCGPWAEITTSLLLANLKKATLRAHQQYATGHWQNVILSHLGYGLVEKYAEPFFSTLPSSTNWVWAARDFSLPGKNVPAHFSLDPYIKTYVIMKSEMPKNTDAVVQSISNKLGNEPTIFKHMCLVSVKTTRKRID